MHKQIAAPRAGNSNSDANKLSPEDKAIHGWYRFVLSYPPHLVQDYLQRLDAKKHEVVLDPFCGTGTTVVECKKLGFASIGVEAHPMAYFAGSVKVDWTVDPDELIEHAAIIAAEVNDELARAGIHDDFDSSLNSDPSEFLRLPRESEILLLTDSISPLPLHKTLVLLRRIQHRSASQCHKYELLALARALVTVIGNLHFGPEVGVSAPKADAPVISSWLNNVQAMANDLRQFGNRWQTPATVVKADSRAIAQSLQPESVDVVITSPPYPNEKDYTRTTRLESVLLGIIRTKQELKTLKRQLMRSNTRNVYQNDSDDKWVADHAEIQRIADSIEARRLDLGKTSGFERLYAKVTRMYFGGMARHLEQLKSVLCRGARLAYVVGDQASYLQVMIRTGTLLADIAARQGFEVLGIDLFRTRLATATRQQLREEVVLLRWPGKK